MNIKTGSTIPKIIPDNERLRINEELRVCRILLLSNQIACVESKRAWNFIVMSHHFDQDLIFLSCYSAWKDIDDSPTSLKSLWCCNFCWCVKRRKEKKNCHMVHDLVFSRLCRYNYKQHL